MKFIYEPNVDNSVSEQDMPTVRYDAVDDSVHLSFPSNGSSKDTHLSAAEAWHLLSELRTAFDGRAAARMHRIVNRQVSRAAREAIGRLVR